MKSLEFLIKNDGEMEMIMRDGQNIRVVVFSEIIISDFIANVINFLRDNDKILRRKYSYCVYNKDISYDDMYNQLPKFSTWQNALEAQKEWNLYYPGHKAKRMK